MIMYQVDDIECRKYNIIISYTGCPGGLADNLEYY